MLFDVMLFMCQQSAFMAIMAVYPQYLAADYCQRKHLIYFKALT